MNEPQPEINHGWHEQQSWLVSVLMFDLGADVLRHILYD